MHQWAQYRFDYEGSVDLDLSVNPSDSSYPLDFRTREQIEAGGDSGVEIRVPTEEDSRDVMNKAIRASGESDKWIFSCHPSTVEKVVRSTSQRR